MKEAGMLLGSALIEACAHWVWLMIKTAEKLGSMNVRAVLVCAKTGIGRRTGHKKSGIRRQFPITPPRKRKSLTVQGDYNKIIDLGRSELCFLGV